MSQQDGALTNNALTILTMLTEQGKDMREGFTRLDAKLDTKLDKIDGAKIEARLNQIDREKESVHAELFNRIGIIERSDLREEGRKEILQAHAAGRFTTAQKIAASIGTTGLIAATLIGPHVHW